ncbi:MAG: cytochrome ubiquinol oxidase subunit I [Pseudomonadota bacterium]|nr:cytochrome ubiquinol oxidase subunit I [Pseudomonadota bacterium]
MEIDPLLLSRIQFGLNISFHIIFPSFTIGLAAWLATLEGLSLFTGRPVYRQLFDFWIKVFMLSFAMGVVTGIIMAVQFGTNWSVLAERAGAIQGPLLGYEAYTAFLLEATFVGVMLFGRGRVPPWLYFLSCCLVALGTTFSAFWIMANNSWMQVPVGHEIVDGRFVATDWAEVVLGEVMRVRFPHMLLGAYLTTAFCVAATGAWHTLRGVQPQAANRMLGMSLTLAAILTPVQLLYGHWNGEYVLNHQPAKFAAIEARWQSQQPASEVLIALPDSSQERNRFSIEIPGLGSYIASGNWTSRETGLDAFPAEDRPPVLIPFFAFRIMVGMGLIMLFLSWTGVWLKIRRRLTTTRWFLHATVFGFPAGFVAILCGWFTAEVGRQPWVVYGLLRTADAVTPSLEGPEVLASLLIYAVVYSIIAGGGFVYIYRLLRDGPAPPGAVQSGFGPSVRSGSGATAVREKNTDDVATGS